MSHAVGRQYNLSRTGIQQVLFQPKLLIIKRLKENAK